MQLKFRLGVHNFFGLWTIDWSILGWEGDISWGSIRKDEYFQWVTGK